MSEKTILIFSYFFPPSPASGVFRCVRFVKGLSRMGWRPLVVAVAPEYVGQQPDESLLDQIPDDVVVKYTPISFPDDKISNALRGKGSAPVKPGSNQPATTPVVIAKQRTGVARLAENIWDYALTTPDRAIWWKKPAMAAACELVREYQPQVVLSTTPPHSSQLIAAKFRRISGIPWVMDMRDPWARGNWPRERNPWGHRMAGRLERRCVQTADKVVLNTGRALEDFRQHYNDQPADKFVCIPNGYDPALLASTEQLLRETVSTSKGRFRLCHPGSLVGRRDPRSLVEAIGKLVADGREVELDLVGNIAPEFEIEKEIRRLQLADRVTITGPVPHRTAMERMAMADGFVVVQPDTQMQVPGKLYEMLMFRKPIVALTGSGATADLVRQYGLGAVSEPNSPDGIAKAIQCVTELRLLSKAAWDDALLAYNGDRLTEKLVAVLDDLVTEKAGVGER